MTRLDVAAPLVSLLLVGCLPDLEEIPADAEYFDHDGDGFSEDDGDCNDGDPNQTPEIVWYPDVDGDGYGDQRSEGSKCEMANASDVLNHTDCNDGNALVYLGAEELCDGIDNDCDAALLFEEEDHDGDGYVKCIPVDGASINGDDCDDTKIEEHPGLTWYPDADTDGYGDAAAAGSPCERVEDSDVSDNRDCDDSDPFEKPHVFWYVDADGDGHGDPTDMGNECERLNGTDVDVNDDCDDADVDEKPNVDWYPDADGDGQGDAQAQSAECERANSTDVANKLDCDDGDGNIYFGGDEVDGSGEDEDCDGVQSCFVDADGDGYRIDTVTVVEDCAEEGVALASEPGGDCDDDDGGEYPGVYWYPDNDGDTYGSSEATGNECERHENKDVADNTDCDDSNEAVHPHAEEVAGSGLDENCNGTQLCYEDLDVDGWRTNKKTLPVQGDCTAAKTARSDIPSGDCDDEDADENPDVYWYPDGDGDAFGDDQSGGHQCDRANLTDVTDNTDCDDDDKGIHPDMVEGVADGIDQNCDGRERCYVDLDRDQHGSTDTALDDNEDCTDDTASQTWDNADDCDDHDQFVFPGAVEFVGLDRNCDGLVRCFVDADGDGYAPNAADTAWDTDGLCGDDTGPGGLVAIKGDCVDTDRWINPQMAEVGGDGKDQNCDGFEACFRDLDGDGYGGDDTALDSDLNCADTDLGMSSNSDDCVDTDEGRNPGEVEIRADGEDQNCDGKEVCWVDLDNDGFAAEDADTALDTDLSCGHDYVTSTKGDCVDTDDSIYPNAPEVVGDGIDQDCDDGDLCYADGDLDGYGRDETIKDIDLHCDDTDVPFTTPWGGDCVDTDAAINPGMRELCDSDTDTDYVDEDCDGVFEEWDTDVANAWYYDGDGDGWGDANQYQCKSEGSFTTQNAPDCDDDDTDSFFGHNCGIYGKIYPEEYVNVTFERDEMHTTAAMAVAIVPDFNGDQINEVLIGAKYTKVGEEFSAGIAYMFFGPVTEQNYDMDNANIVFRDGLQPDKVGAAVIGTGNIFWEEASDPQFNDFVVSAEAKPNGTGGAGLVYLFAGTDGVKPKALSDAAAKIRYTGNAYHYFGRALAVGDFDNSGVNDLVIGTASDEAYLFWGPLQENQNFTPSNTLDETDADVHFEDVYGTKAGAVLAGVGDFDGDNSEDLLIGATDGGQAAHGAAYLFLDVAMLTGSVDMTAAEWRYDGTQAYDHAGNAVAAIGDVNDDDYDDLIIGAEEQAKGESTTREYGAAYIILGSSDTPETVDLGTAPIQLLGDDINGNVGTAVAGAGDTNSNGLLEVLVGAPEQDDLGYAYLVEIDYTTSGVFEIADFARATIKCQSYRGYCGQALAGGADFNGDAIDDILVAAPALPSVGAAEGWVFGLFGTDY
ncbi:MAG: hypothetical protein HN348_00275 [Proteobacteria bacterium]|jgi:hypothetical protein|nr:hypothetical protein [Pseudomonadota bacterium]